MKIIHCFRSPVGGIFRHVRDLLSEQKKAGHQVGFICDSSTGGDYENRLFDSISPDLELGLHRIPMARSISPKDPLTLWKLSRIVKSIAPDVVHSHSAKGGVYGRISAKMASTKDHRIKAFYCPHGGAMHYDSASAKGKIFFAAERFLERYTDSLIFVSGYERDAYHDKVGTPACAETIVYNGLSLEEFSPVAMSDQSADFLYIGMMRDLKGPDVFLKALKIARETSKEDLTAWFVGDGEDKPRYISFIKENGLEDAVTVSAAMPAREAFSKADTIVVPSRAESMPYLVLEAMAAEKPIICTNVGGIHEIFAQEKDRLIAADDPELLAQTMLTMRSDKARHQEASLLAVKLKERFSLDVMADSVEKTYLSS